MTKTERLSSAKPIVFDTEMAKAAFDGRKTTMRLIALPNEDLHEFRSEKYPDGWWLQGRVFKNWSDMEHYMKICECPCKYTRGDILYVKETWCEYDSNDVIDGVKYAYKANATPFSEEVRKELGYKWRPSIHMPKEAARIFLRVTDVRLDRLQNMSGYDFDKEGFDLFETNYFENSDKVFQKHWDAAIKKPDLDRYGWEADPWIWVIEFERVHTQE